MNLEYFINKLYTSHNMAVGFMSLDDVFEGLSVFKSVGSDTWQILGSSLFRLGLNQGINDIILQFEFFTEINYL